MGDQYGENSIDLGDDPEAQQQSTIDRRYLDLRSRVLDLDGLRNITPPTPLVDGYLS